MNTKDLIRLGVPVGEPIQLAYEFIQNFITPDGRRAVLAASFDSTPLLVWDLEERPKRSYARRPQRSVTAVAITPDGRHAVSASRDNTLRVWDLESGKELALLTADSPTISCAVSLDGRTIVAGDVIGKIHILRMEGFS